MPEEPPSDSVRAGCRRAPRAASWSWRCCSPCSGSRSWCRSATPRPTTPTRACARASLIQVLDGLTGTAERARREVDRLESRRDELQDENQARSAALDEAEQRVRTLNIIAGLVPVSGPGLRITITESTSRVSVGSLLDTVQELRTAGAEAMEFNDTIRLGADSSFQNAVGGVELDDQLLEPPYVIDVIGDAHVLRTALTFSTGPVETLQTLDGATVQIEELESVDITSVRAAARPGYAEPGPGQ